MVTIKHKVTIKTKTAQEETSETVGGHVVTLKRKQPEDAPVAEKPSVTLKKKQPEVAPETNPRVKPQPVVKPEPKPTSAQVPEKKSNTGKIVGGIAVVAAILAGVYFFGIKSDDNVADNGGATTEQIAQVGETNQPADDTEKMTLGEESISDNDVEAADLAEANETSASGESSNASTLAKVDEKQTEKPSTNGSPAAKPTQPSQPKQNNASTANAVSATAPIGSDVVENAKRVIRGDFGNGQERKDKLGSAYTEIQSKVNEMYRQGLVR